ncbi:MAG: hypothetical protein AAFR97_09875 [Bacteroidota bacterium]
MSRLIKTFAFATCLLIVACGGETSAGGDEANQTEENTTTNAVNPTNITAVDPASVSNQDLPESCSILDEESVRQIFGLDEEQALIPVHGQLFGSCYYRFASDAWTADLVLETINADQETIFQQQFDASSERTTLAGNDARWENDGRILLVDAEEPYIVKLSILPRGEYGKAVDESERRAFIEAVAELVNEKM